MWPEAEETAQARREGLAAGPRAVAVRIESMAGRGQQEKALGYRPIQEAMTPPGADPSDTVWELLQGAEGCWRAWEKTRGT